MNQFICYEVDDTDQPVPFTKFTAKGEDYGAGIVLTSFNIENEDLAVSHSFGDTTLPASYVEVGDIRGPIVGIRVVFLPD